MGQFSFPLPSVFEQSHPFLTFSVGPSTGSCVIFPLPQCQERWQFEHASDEVSLLLTKAYAIYQSKRCKSSA